ncbi:MAG: GNAT family N-acetyltransferase [Clostridia bacterium]
MKLQTLINERMTQFGQLYRKAFPLLERKPLWLLKSGMRAGTVDLFTFEEDGFCGLAAVIVGETLAMIDYLAVVEEKRSGGIGSKTLALLKERYAGKCLMLLVEPPDETAPNAGQRIRRLAFYHKNGFNPTGLRVTEFANAMDVLSDGRSVDFVEYCALLERAHGRFWTQIIHPRIRKDFC